MAAYIVLLIRSETTAHGHIVDHLERPSPSWLASAALMVAALVAIVAGATAMVDTALVVAGSVGLPHALVGLVVLAAVTSLPNVSTAIRLARAGRGDATVSETMNSNTLNLIGGVIVPAAVVGLGTVAATTAGDLVWLAALTAGTIAALTMRRGMGRVAGAALVAAYAAFLVVHL
jgi:cation:H+ antiporter